MEGGMRMADREKVIKGVEHCFHGQECCGDIKCPYYIEHLSDSCCIEDCQENLKADAIALLKEQDELLKHEYWRGYTNGRADERGLQEGTIMQTFSPD